MKPMDEININSWISQPDVCRCCLSSCGSWDLTASYITEAGNKEVFTEMLQDCYGITLTCLKEWGPSRLVCGLCVGHLREACAFKKQVLSAERLFIDYCSSKKDISDVQIKSETESTGDRQSPFNFTDDLKNYDDNMKDIVESYKLDVKMQVDAKESTTQKRRKNHLKVKKKRRVINMDEVDSDTPISVLMRKKVSEIGVGSGLEEIESDKSEGCKNETQQAEVDMQGRLSNPLESIVKLVSERKRVIITCDTVLRETTACPFRHHKSWFRCFFCTVDFMEINQLRQHTLETHADVDDELRRLKRYPRSLQIEISNLECRHCGLTLTDVESMRRHFFDAHKKVIYNECIADYKVNASPYSCHLCGKQYHVFRTLTTHLNEHYANCICDVCGKSFLNSKRLKVHKRTHENGQYPCGECGKVLKTKTSKANHMESVHSKRVIKCQICLKPMKHYNHRIKHMSEDHGITHKFKCPICSREYNIKHYLATHIRQTHGHKNKKCSDCGMAFITNHGLKKHMLKHTGVKAFTCSVCSKSYARSYTLREHMKAHESERRILGPA